MPWGGSGVWWLGRAITKQDADIYGLACIPLSPAGEQLAYYKQEAEGVCFYTNTWGFNGSFTRSEIAAGIIAACANGPWHLASDSEVLLTVLMI